MTRMKHQTLSIHLPVPHQLIPHWQHPSLRWTTGWLLPLTTRYASLTSPPNWVNITRQDQTALNRGTQYNSPLPIIAQAIWDGHEILSIDSSVWDDVTTYAWVLSTTDFVVKVHQHQGWQFPALMASYADPY